MAGAEHRTLLDPTGAFGGGQIGYNFQRGNIVFGIETDIQGSGISDSGCGGASHRSTGSAAFAAALAMPSIALSSMGLAVSAMGRSRTTAMPRLQTGWVAGGGVEYKLTPAWSAKAEYQYFDLGASSSCAGPLGDAYGDRTQFSTFRVGVNYFVGGGYDPLK